MSPKQSRYNILAQSYNFFSHRWSLDREMLRWSPSRLSTTYVRSTLLAIFLLLGYFLFSRQQQTLLPNDFPLETSALCTTNAYSRKVVVSVKTGATEATEKIPTQMRTTLLCMENVILFSDLEQDIGEYHLHDALDTVSASVVSTNSDFKFYTKQKELWQAERNITSLKGARNPENPIDLAAWRLDKYKFIHLLEKTWALKPDMDWYVLIDADTYVLWPNMLRWLQALDPTKKSYFGSEVSIGGTRFAHGGSGIVLSKAAMYELVVTFKGTAEKWDSKTYDHCCGDLVLSMALGEHGTQLQDVWPLMSGETPFTMPFGPGTPDYWCQPALTMHHLTPDDMRKLAEFEGSRKLNRVSFLSALSKKNCMTYPFNLATTDACGAL